MWRFRANVALPLIILGICLGCASLNAPPKNPAEESVAILNLSAVTNSGQTEVFIEVRHPSRLPSAVLDKLGQIAGPGERFNTSDVYSSKGGLPRQQLITAAVSENYCIVTYVYGRYTMGIETKVFELSGDKRIWVSVGGGLNFQDLIETMEKGRLLQFKRVQ